MSTFCDECGLWHPGPCIPYDGTEPFSVYVAKLKAAGHTKYQPEEARGEAMSATCSFCDHDHHMGHECNEVVSEHHDTGLVIECGCERDPITPEEAGVRRAILDWAERERGKAERAVRIAALERAVVEAAKAARFAERAWTTAAEALPLFCRDNAEWWKAKATERDALENKYCDLALALVTAVDALLAEEGKA